MSMKRTAARIAANLVGMPEERATEAVLHARCGYRFIVMDGRRCGRNTNVDNQTVCLFSAAGRITHAVVGSKGIYEHPAYLAAAPREESVAA